MYGIMAEIEIRPYGLLHRRTVLKVLVLLALAPLSSQERLVQLSLGGAVGWESIAQVENIRMTPGWGGGYEVVLREDRSAITDETDLFLETEEGVFDVTGFYRIEQMTARRVEGVSRLGLYSLYFDGGSLVELVPGNSETVFSPMQQVGSLSINFWLYPLATQDGARIFSWSGTRFTPDGVPQQQRFYLEFRDRRLHWVLENLFLTPDNRETKIELTSRSITVPERWRYHQLQFDDTTGAVIYRIDGVPVAIEYANDDGAETGETWYVTTGSECEKGISLGRDFIGLLDDFTVSRALSPIPDFLTYDGRPGTVLTDLIDLEGSGAVPEKIEAVVETPGQTSIELYYRLGNRRYSGDPVYALPGHWKRVPHDGILRDEESGRFLQLQARLLADAGRQVSPALKGIDISYRDISPPVPPVSVSAESIPGGVKINWEAVRSPNTAGYRIYFGTRRGSYTGTEDLRSPIDVGAVTEYRMELGEPGRPYVFAVESYDAYGQRSSLSVEREARSGGATQ